LSAPLIFAGDFNMADPVNMLEQLRGELNLEDSLPDQPTKPHVDWHLDCIFVSGDYEVIDSAIIQTETDHFLGWASVLTD
jgi:hypothetical protein